MELEFPEFPEPMTLDGTRSWTARFDSFNERTDDLYYVVSIHQDGTVVNRFVVNVSPDGDPAPALWRLAASSPPATAATAWGRPCTRTRTCPTRVARVAA